MTRRSDDDLRVRGQSGAGSRREQRERRLLGAPAAARLKRGAVAVRYVQRRGLPWSRLAVVLGGTVIRVEDEEHALEALERYGGQPVLVVAPESLGSRLRPAAAAVAALVPQGRRRPPADRVEAALRRALGMDSPTRAHRRTFRRMIREELDRRDADDGP